MKELDKITEKDFIKYVNKVRNDEITNVAPLGFSGDDFIVYETENKPLKKEFITKEEYDETPDGDGYGCKGYYDKPVIRSSQVSFRKYGSECELLITDYEGNFLTYSKLNFAFSDVYIGKTFYRIFSDLKPYIKKVIKKIDEKIDWKKVNFSKGFDMLVCYEKHKENLMEDRLGSEIE